MRKLPHNPSLRHHTTRSNGICNQQVMKCIRAFLISKDFQSKPYHALAQARQMAHVMQGEGKWFCLVDYVFLSVCVRERERERKYMILIITLKDFSNAKYAI